jgi:hypothetical protein
VAELFPAVAAAERAVQLQSNWPIAHQTLGRAQTGIGEIEMVFPFLSSDHASLLCSMLQALSSFQKSLHLDPTCAEVA